MGQLRKLRKSNISKILKAIHDLGPMSKKMIAEHVGLSTTLLTKICNQLKAEGIIKEGDSLKSKKAGRREVLIDINYDHKLIAGVDLYSDKTTIIITNLQPAVLYQKTIPTPKENIEEFLQSLTNMIKDYIAFNKLNENDFIGLGVGVKGGISVDTGILSSELWGRSINLKEFFEKELSIPLFYENETNNLAITEHFFREDKSDFFMVRYGSDGIGGAIFKNGELLLNENNTTGKIGHMIIDPSQDFCKICKRKGCLESIVSIEKIFTDITALYNNNKLPILQKITDNDISKLDYNTLFTAYNNGSIELNAIIRRSAVYLAQAILSTFSLLGIKDFILHGCFFDYPEYVALLQHNLTELQLGNDAPILHVSEISTSETNPSSALLVLSHTLYRNY